MEKVEPTELDKEMIEKSNEKKEKYLTQMVMHKALWNEDKTNDYNLFLYIASIMDFVEYHNEGCMTELGHKSLEMDISKYIAQINNQEPLTQKDMIRFLLNVINSYAVSVLCKGLFVFAKEEPENFFALNDFPSGIREDFQDLEDRLDEVIPHLDKILEAYCPTLEIKYKKIFNEEKIKGFKKSIFKDSQTPIKLNQSGFPTGLENAQEVK
jgi:hypothetical protein